MYAGGSSWTGEVFLDTLGLGYGSPSVPLELVEIESQNQFLIRDATFQGILGLGPSDLAVRGTDAYFSQETAAGVSSVLAFELCSSSGTMWMGGFDGSAAATTMQYTPLLAIGKSNPYYSINVDDLLIGGSSLGFQSADFQSPVLDTGTSLFYLPTPVFNAMLSAINGSSGYSSVFGSMPLSAGGNGCVSAQGATAASVDAALPTMAMTLPGSGAGAPSFTVELQPTQSYLLDAGRGTFCLAAGDGGSLGGAILGDAFLSAFVTVIDQANLRAGLAPDAGCSAQPGRRVIDLTTWHPRLPRRTIRR
jgi:hypothetical protein